MGKMDEINFDTVTIDDVVQNVREMVEGVGARFEDPEEDWSPALMMFGKESAIALIPQMGDPDLKEICADKIIPELLVKVRPRFAALVMMGWSIEYDRETLEGRAQQARDEATYAVGNIADRPGKHECLVVHVVQNDGHEKYLHAYVHRYPSSSPVLQWRKEVEIEGKSAGRFPDALRKGMELAWTT